jgi:hypothetical protein
MLVVQAHVEFVSFLLEQSAVLSKAGGRTALELVQRCLDTESQSPLGSTLSRAF